MVYLIVAVMTDGTGWDGMYSNEFSGRTEMLFWSDRRSTIQQMRICLTQNLTHIKSY